MRFDGRRGVRCLVWLGLFCGVLVRADEGSSAVDGTPGADTASQPVWLARAHAHNDYEHDRPLLDALSHGFASVEADIFLADDALLVAHHRLQLRRERTLAALYLDPLFERVRTNGGRVYRGGGEFTLLIDLKTDAEATWRALSSALEPYAEMLTEVRDGKEIPRAVRVILSGNRPRRALAEESRRFASYDGRLSDIARLRERAARGEPGDAAEPEERALEPPHFLPLVSDKWSDHFEYGGRGEMPIAERERLEEIVRVAHAAGRRLRFWATADTPEMWGVLYDAGVDFINTDDLPGLASFLRERAASAKSQEEEEKAERPPADPSGSADREPRERESRGEEER